LSTSFGTGVRWLWFRLSKSKAYRPCTFATASGGIVYHTSCVESTGLDGNRIGVCLHLGFIGSVRLSALADSTGHRRAVARRICLLSCCPLVALIFTCLPLTCSNSVWYGAAYLFYISSLTYTGLLSYTKPKANFGFGEYLYLGEFGGGLGKGVVYCGSNDQSW
jgi:hypothetical protein